MSEPEADRSVARVVRLVLFAEWRAQVKAGHLTRDGLMAVRGRLDPVQREFEVGEDLDELRRLVAGALGVGEDDMPDTEMPDYPPMFDRW